MRPIQDRQDLSQQMQKKLQVLLLHCSFCSDAYFLQEQPEIYNEKNLIWQVKLNTLNGKIKYIEDLLFFLNNKISV